MKKGLRLNFLGSYDAEQPIYNTRFLAFATYYGFRPVACRPRRPQTKGKIERPFWYLETNLLNGRTFSTLEHLNETTAYRWFLAIPAFASEPIMSNPQNLPPILFLVVVAGMASAKLLAILSVGICVAPKRGESPWQRA